jgi:hypothetical protein
MAQDVEYFKNLITVGNSEAILKGLPGTPLEGLLKDLMQDVADQLVTEMDRLDIAASRRLRQSIIPDKQVTKEGNVVTIGLSADFYWKFVNYGVNGTEVQHGAPSWGRQPPGEVSFHKSIMDWTMDRGITMPAQFDTYDSFAWAVMANVRKKGKQARPFFTNVVNETLTTKIQGELSAFFKEAITVNIVEPWQ